MESEHDGITQEELPDFVEQAATQTAEPAGDPVSSEASSGGSGGGESSGGSGGGGLEQVPWSQLWHVPALLLGLGVFALGLYLVVPSYAPPDYHGMLDDVDALIGAESATELETAREKMKVVNAGFEAYPPGDEVRGRFWQYAADLNYLDMSIKQGVPVGTENSIKNRDRVLEYYDDAERFGRKLDNRSRRWKALTLVALERPIDALRLVDQLDPLRPEHRYTIIRELIEREAQGPDPASSTLEAMLRRFQKEVARETDKGRRLEQRVWAVSFRAQRYLDVGDPQQAIDYLNVETQRLRSAGRFDVPELLVLLAEGHRRAGSFEESKRLFFQAQRMVAAGHGLNAPIVIGLADIELAHGGEGYFDRAHALYRQAEKQYPASDLVVDAMIGQANIETQQGRHGDAVKHYREAVRRLVNRAESWDARRDEIIEQVATHVERARDQDRFDDALDLLAVAVPLYGCVV